MTTRNTRFTAPEKSRRTYGSRIDELRRQWDEIAPIRFREIHLGTDLNHAKVLSPIIIEQFRKFGPRKRCLDIGCGFGDISKRLVENGAEFIRAVDFSYRSIELAKRHYADPRIEYVCDISTNQYTDVYNAIIASMFLMDSEHLEEEVRGISKSLETGGLLIASVPHPCFWPIRRRYAEDPEFNYFSEIAWRGPYSLSNEALHGFQTTHFTRPLSEYLNTLASNRLQLLEMHELMDHAGEDGLPRFMALTCTKL